MDILKILAEFRAEREQVDPRSGTHRLWSRPASWTPAEMDDQDEVEGATTRQQE
jgi:hypothetical protein